MLRKCLEFLGLVEPLHQNRDFLFFSERGTLDGVLLARAFAKRKKGFGPLL